MCGSIGGGTGRPGDRRGSKPAAQRPGGPEKPSSTAEVVDQAGRRLTASVSETDTQKLQF